MPTGIECRRCERCDEVTPHRRRRAAGAFASASALALAVLFAGVREAWALAGLAALGAVLCGLAHRKARARLECERCLGHAWAARQGRWRRRLRELERTEVNAF